MSGGSSSHKGCEVLSVEFRHASGSTVVHGANDCPNEDGTKRIVQRRDLRKDGGKGHLWCAERVRGSVIERCFGSSYIYEDGQTGKSSQS